MACEKTAAEAWPSAATSSAAEWIPDLVVCFPRSTRSEEQFAIDDIRVIFSRMLTGWLKNKFQYNECAKLASGEAGHFTTKRRVQNALLKDFVEFLSEAHCTSEVFQSCDRDELFLCIALGDPSKPAQEDPATLQLAEQRHLRVQTDLAGLDPNSALARRLRDIRAKEPNREQAIDQEREFADPRALGILYKSFGIVQTMSPNEEMYVFFDRKIAGAMTQFCGLPQIGSQENEPTFLKRYPAGIAGVDGSIFRTVDRVRLLVSKISEFVHLDEVVDEKLAVCYYVPHKFSKLEEFRNGKLPGDRYYDKGHVPWSNFRLRTVLGALRYAGLGGQPFEEIRNYFGQPVAFYFLWLGYSTQCVVLALPLSIVLTIVYNVVYSTSDTDQASPYDLAVQMWCHLCTTSVFSIGCTMYLKYWKRCESYFEALWDTDISEIDIKLRPQFHGTPAADPLDEWGKATKEFPVWKSRALYVLALGATFFFIILVMISVTLIYYAQVLFSRWGVSDETASILVSAAFSVQIFVFQVVWNSVSARLVDFVNPRTDEDAKNLAVQFLFPFSFISSYANIIFHGFYTSWNETCLHKNCMQYIMRPSTYQVVVPAMGMHVAKMLLPFLKYRYSLNDEVWRMRQSGKLKDTEQIARCFIEAQAKRPHFTSDELNSEMNIMVVMCGYVIMFGFVAPGIIAIVAVAFMLKIRIDAFKLCSVYQRVMPLQAVSIGIGKWDSVLREVVVIGRYCACAIPVFNLRYFELPGRDAMIVRLMKGGDEDQKLSFVEKCVVMFLLSRSLEILCSALEHSIDNVSQETKQMVAKRTKAQATMQLKIASHNDRRRSNTVDGDGQSIHELKALLANIQTESHDPFSALDSTHRLWSRVERRDFSPLLDGKTYFGEESR